MYSIILFDVRLVFFVLFLVSSGSTSMGGVGDVYFCEEIQNILVDRDSGRKVPNNKFEFKISERVIEVEQGDAAFSNKKYFIEFMGNYNGDDFISAYDISTKFVLKNEKLLLITSISYSGEGFVNVIAECTKIVEAL